MGRIKTVGGVAFWKFQLHNVPCREKNRSDIIFLKFERSPKKNKKQNKKIAYITL